jgi:hypothetical protein
MAHTDLLHICPYYGFVEKSAQGSIQHPDTGCYMKYREQKENTGYMAYEHS